MARIRSVLVGLAVATALVVAVQKPLEAVDVRVEHDKAFDFGPVRTWGWNPEGAGNVRMARTQDDDPEAMKRRVDPLIREAVVMEMTRRGLKEASSAPDVTVTYFLLLSTGATAQTMGQFLPATTAWALPVFAPATQSMQVMNAGALVIDLSSKGVVVWRGVAQSKIKMDASDKERESRLREGVRDLLKRYPPKK